MKWIDLRSDTVTLPTSEMWAAMTGAEVGDDVYGEDPTVNRLQEMAAQMLGKEAALFVPSGTMGNLASMLAHCGRGDEVILGDLSHTYLFEAGGIAALGGVHPRVIPNRPDGTLPLETIEASIRAEDPHFPTTRCISLESTHNRCRGAVLPLSYVQAVGALAKRHNLKLHLDGARFFNACVALDVDPVEYAAPFDSVTFCLSKALCAPVGSLIVGDEDFIYRAHRARKILGGGMRQAGVLAAAGIVALQQMVERLADDHARARKLAQKLATIPGISLENPEPASNMLYLNLTGTPGFSDQEFMDRVQSHGVLIHDVGARRYRLVTHYWIDDTGVEKAASAIRSSLEMA